ncbi:unnamed protein product [Diamesa serratosioi]
MDHHSMQQHHHHQIQNAQIHHPIHWNYSSTAISTLPSLTSTPIASSHTNNLNNNSNSSTGSNNNTWTSPSTRGLKRTISESDCDDLFSDSESKERASSIENDSCQLMSRKKRRGVIEKKRRDRINSSLSELKRLVPSAFEKQGSAKLEKAEILQLTVDHLKLLHSKGIDSVGFDPQRFAMDYHVIGFRECVSEVARYLISVEGMDLQDPMRLRLMSHLQCFVAQRELTVKSTNTSATPTKQSNNSSSTSPSVVAATTSTTPSEQQDSHPVYTDLSNTNDRLLNLGGSYLNYGNQLYGTNNNNGYNNSTNNSKPYRPWHPEMSAY